MSLETAVDGIKATPGEKAFLLTNAKDCLFPERLRRLNFFVRAVALEGSVFWALSELGTQLVSESGKVILAVITVSAVIYGVFFIYRPRARDSGMPAWTLIFAAVPYVNSIYGLLLLLGSSKSPLFEKLQPDKIDEPRISTVAGASCSVCGTRLILASEGVITESEAVVCNRCLPTQSGAEQD